MQTRSDRNPFFSVVVPLFREEEHLEEVVTRIRQAIDPLQLSWELILVDDGSPDGTWQSISRLSGMHSNLHGIRLSRNFGKEAALCAGLERATGDAVVIMDGDLQHPPDLIPEMVGLWRDGGAEVVEAVKDDRGRESLLNRLGSRLFYAILNLLAGYDLKDTSDFKLLDRRVVQAWLTMGERNLFFRGMVAWLGFSRAEVRFCVPDRVAGTTGFSLFRLVRLAITAIASFSSISLHAVTLVGGIFLLFAAALGVQTLVNKASGEAVSGFTTVILLQLIIGSMVMISLGIIGEYIARIFKEVKQRPRYLISDETDTTGDR
ncbi:MAG: glycosyltransferase family 2 protein [Acidobacteria bacterium]|uniref:Glycosyltransferase family 2 protein n=1 Tax=Candidatus Polarisedimenticola svalbardensis TaxID=2886004 RepID=A0A8J6XVZ6_9BACT|nr:glycosyltransferase family 2 protein [Candidatus Polarisedimenticola svalbardensis]